MDNEPTSDPKIITQYNYKQMLVSIFIGFIISALTVLFQAFVDWLQDIPAALPGGVVGMVKYWTAWKYNHNA